MQRIQPHRLVGAKLGGSSPPVNPEVCLLVVAVSESAAAPHPKSMARWALARNAHDHVTKAALYLLLRGRHLVLVAALTLALAAAFWFLTVAAAGLLPSSGMVGIIRVLVLQRLGSISLALCRGPPLRPGLRGSSLCLRWRGSVVRVLVGTDRAYAVSAASGEGWTSVCLESEANALGKKLNNKSRPRVFSHAVSVPSRKWSSESQPPAAGAASPGASRNVSSSPQASASKKWSRESQLLDSMTLEMKERLSSQGSLLRESRFRKRCKQREIEDRVNGASKKRKMSVKKGEKGKGKISEIAVCGRCFFPNYWCLQPIDMSNVYSLKDLLYFKKRLSCCRDQ